MLISKTPLRVSFLGGGTDYQSYFKSHHGAVLGGTFDKYVYIHALPLSPIAEQNYRITYRAIESVNAIEEISHPVIREALKLYKWQDPLNIATMSDLPGSTGLGSSSSFTVGFLNLINKIRGVDLTKYELARQAIHLERHILKENVGVQDQIHASFGGLARYEFYDNDFSIQPLRLTTDRLNVLNQSMLLVYTGAQRSASAVVEDQEKRTQKGDNETYLREMYDLTKVGMTVLEDEGDDQRAIIQFAELLDHSWALKRQLSGAVSSTEINALYEAGKSLGAYGGKLLGAGGGGFMLFLVDPLLHPVFADHFGKENIVKIAMVNSGSSVFSL